MTDRIFKNRYLLIMDVIGFVASYLLVNLLAAFSGGYLACLKMFMLPGIISAAVFIVSEYFYGIYRVMWRYCSIVDCVRLLYSGIVGFLMTVAIFIAYGLLALNDVFPGLVKFGISFGFLGVVSIFSVRVFVYILYRFIRYKQTRSYEKAKRLLIVGAGYSASLMIRDMARNVNLSYDIVGFVDDDETKIGRMISGYRVLGTRDDIEHICKTYKVDEILMAMPSASSKDRKEVISICNNTSCKVKTIPSIDQMITNGKFRMRDIEIDDLLEREEISLCNEEIAEYITHKKVMITGGGGSIGSELCRQVMRFNPKKLIIVDIYENNAYDIQMELNGKYPENRPEVIIASVRDKERLDKIFADYKPEIVFHAAAHKHVPLMENSPSEAIRNNVVGTYNVAKCADENGVRKFVMISTDKAVNPTNIMGASKRMCEMIIQAMQKVSKTEFVAVRFGNVLGSNGSVVPLFKKQIANGGPVTITHRDITRFFMTIPEAAQLVIQAGAYAKGGEIFVLDMGEPVRIYDLAKNIIKLSGYRPGVDIEIKEVGLRPGEKLYEELMMSEEGLTKTKHSKIFIGHSTDIDIDEVEAAVEKLVKAAHTQNRDEIKAVLKDVVPTYKEPDEVNAIV